MTTKVSYCKNTTYLVLCFVQSLPWLFNRTLLTEIKYLFIAILWAEMSRVNWAYHKYFKIIQVFWAQQSSIEYYFKKVSNGLELCWKGEERLEQITMKIDFSALNMPSEYSRLFSDIIYCILRDPSYSFLLQNKRSPVLYFLWPEKIGA